MNRQLSIPMFLLAFLLFSCSDTGRPRNAERKFKEGLKYYQQEEYGKAITSFSDAIMEDPTYYEAFNNRGLAKGRLGKSSNAIEDFSNAIDLDIDFDPARQNRLKFYLEADSFSQAEPDAKYLSSKFADSASFQHIYGLVLLNLGKYAGAVAYFSRTIDLDPTFTEAYINRSTAFYMLGNKMGAQVDVEYVLVKDSVNVLAYNNLAIIQAERGFYDEAQLSINGALSIEPDNPILLSNYAFILLMRDKPEKANEAIGKLEKMGKGDDPYMLVNKGFYSLRTGNYRAALESFSAARAGKPDIERVNYLTSIVYDKLNLRDSACYYLEKAFERQEFDSGRLLDSLCKNK